VPLLLLLLMWHHHIELFFFIHLPLFRFPHLYSAPLASLIVFTTNVSFLL